MTFDEVEKARINYRHKFNKVLSIYILIVVILFIISILFLSIVISFALATYSVVLGIIIISFITRKDYQLYKNAYKSYFVSASLAKVFSNINYNHNTGLDPAIVRQVMTTANRYHSNDYMTATYKNINFTQADVHTEEEHTTTDSDGHTTTTYTTIFKGRFLIFDFDRNFSSNLQISSKHFNGETIPYSMTSKRKFEKIKTESTEFNKNFRIYAQDNIDALYILDPAFMEKIQKLYTDCRHELLLTFMNKKVYIAINDKKDSLEPPSTRKPLDEKVEIEKVKKDILVITNFVDSLNLDRYFKGKK